MIEFGTMRELNGFGSQTGNCGMPWFLMTATPVLAKVLDG